MLAACSGEQDRPGVYELAGAAMGTTWSIKLADLPDEVDRAQLRDDVEAMLVSTERTLSTYMPESDLSRFNASRNTDWIAVSLELCATVEAALEFGRLSGGAFDITVGPVVNLWGFGPEGHRSEPPAADQIAAALAETGLEHLDTDCQQPALKKDLASLYVDLSAFAKGYTVDKLGSALRSHGVDNFLVELGGELLARGVNGRGEPWAIAIEEPRLAGRSVQTIVGLDNTGMATSGDYRNFFEHDDRLYSHTIDPRSGEPISHAGASVTVVSDSAGFADAMATALLVLGPEDGIAFADRYDIAAYFLIRTESGIDERRSEHFATEVTLL